MRLLLVTPWPLASRGGGQRLAREVARSLAGDHGLEVIAAAGSGTANGLPYEPAVAPLREIRLPLACRQFGAWRRGRIQSIAYLDGLEALAARLRPDLVLFVSHYSSCAEQAARLAADYAVPFVFWPAIHLDDRSHTHRAAHRLYRAASLVVSLSETEHRWLIHEARVASDRALAIGCGFGGEVVRRPRRAVHAQRPLRLLSVGAFASHKQFDHQIETLRLLRDRHGIDAHLTIAGAVRDADVFASLRALACHRSLEAHVHFVPNYSEDAVAELHHESDLFLFTSRSESYGLALLDAIAFGVTPLVYPHSIYREMIDASRFGYVAARPTPEALASALRRAVTSKDEQPELDRLEWLAARRWPVVTRPLVAAITQLVDRRTAALDLSN